MDNEIVNQPVIFRFRSLNINSLNSLINNYLWFSPLKNINDPFDGSADYLWDKKDNTELIKLAKENPVFSNLDDEAFDTILSSMNPYFTDRVPVLVSCFSLKYKDILMWSHYADGHRGFCQIFLCKQKKGNLFLEIDDTSLLERKEKMLINGNLLPLIPVSYNNEKIEPIKTSMLENVPGNNTKLSNAFQKAKAWEYESEHRAVVFLNCLNNSNKLYYPDSSLFGIILGSEMDDESKKLMEIICKTKNIHLYQMKKTFNKYELQWEMIF